MVKWRGSVLKKTKRIPLFHFTNNGYILVVFVISKIYIVNKKRVSYNFKTEKNALVFDKYE